MRSAVTNYLILLFCAFLLSACTAQSPPQPDPAPLLVSITEVEGCQVQNNGLRVSPGEDAVFRLKMEPDFSVSGVDYDGEWELAGEGNEKILTLQNIRVPARVTLTLTNRFTYLCYRANGGEGNGEYGEEVIKSCDLTNHIRPNTARASELFTRPGYSLTSWNTEADGSGVRVGLGSRVTTEGWKTVLYAQWEKWSAEENFRFEIREEKNSKAAIRRGGPEIIHIAVITGYTGEEDRVVVPAELSGCPVKEIARDAFAGCPAQAIVLPLSLRKLEEGAFRGAKLTELTLYDNLADFSDQSFAACENLKTLYINAQEAPYGAIYHRENCYADKADLLITAKGSKKLVFYGGCSAWFNLSPDVMRDDPLYRECTVIDMGLNGTVNGAIQMDILSAYLEAGDILFHTPELSSRFQMMSDTRMRKDDARLWCGLDANYDLLSQADLTKVTGLFDSFCYYLSLKDRTASYTDVYEDDKGRRFFGPMGTIPFWHAVAEGIPLGDEVSLAPETLTPEETALLRESHRLLKEKGVDVYLSYACLNVDALSPEEIALIPEMDARYHKVLGEEGNARVISHLSDFLYHEEDFYDTNYHLLSPQADENTRIWLRDLHAALEDLP